MPKLSFLLCENFNMNCRKKFYSSGSGIRRVLLHTYSTIDQQAEIALSNNVIEPARSLSDFRIEDILTYVLV